jgi:hypothetical protein
MSTSKTQTTSQTSEPWGAAQPHLGSTLAGAADLYGRGVGGGVFKGSTVVPYSRQTTHAQDLDEELAYSLVSPTKSYLGEATNLAMDGGLNTLQQGAIDRLTPMADGKMLTGNPYAEDIIKLNARDMGDAINLSSSGAGRYGSGAHQELLAQNIGDMASKARFDNFNTERGYQQDAIGSLFNAGQQQRDNIGTAGSVLSNAMEMRNMPSNLLRGVGAEMEDLYGRNINDRLRIFDAEQNAPWEQLGRYNAIATGAGQMGGTTQGTAQMPGRGFGDVAGSLVSLLGLL